MGVSSFSPAFGSFTYMSVGMESPLRFVYYRTFYLVFYCFLLQYLYILFVHFYAQC